MLEGALSKQCGGEGDKQEYIQIQQVNVTQGAWDGERSVNMLA